MSEKTINLEEILKSKFPSDEESGLSFDLLNNTTKKFIVNAMVEFGKQLLELAAENANMACVNYKGTYFTKKEYLDNYTDITVNKQSILDTISQII